MSTLCGVLLWFNKLFIQYYSIQSSFFPLMYQGIELTSPGFRLYCWTQRWFKTVYWLILRSKSHALRLALTTSGGAPEWEHCILHLDHPYSNSWIAWTFKHSRTGIIGYCTNTQKHFYLSFLLVDHLLYMIPCTFLYILLYLIYYIFFITWVHIITLYMRIHFFRFFSDFLCTFIYHKKYICFTFLIYCTIVTLYRG